MRITRATAFARAALLGNPSDAYGGRTISFAFENFAATVVIYEWPRLEIVPGPSDQVSFDGLRSWSPTWRRTATTAGFVW